MATGPWTLDGPPPVEHRLLGLDRRTLWPTLAALAVVLVWTTVVPAIDQAVDALEIAPGTVYDMGVASFTPTPGWILARPPSPVGETRDATIVKESVTLRVQGSTWSGTAAELLDQVTSQQNEYILEGQTYQIRTERGVRGVAKRFSGPDYVGLLATFVAGGGGIAFTAKGPPDAADALGVPVAEMIRSLTFTSEETRP